MESTCEIGHGRTGESSKKSYKYDLGFKDFSYEKRMDKCGLNSLDRRKSR